jgi:hypothetical protein
MLNNLWLCNMHYFLNYKSYINFFRIFYCEL